MPCPSVSATGLGLRFTSRRGEFLDQRAERVDLRRARDLVVELEAAEDVLDVGRESVEAVLEVRPGAAAGWPWPGDPQGFNSEVL